MTNPTSVYFAGELFDHKDLFGNKILATYIERCSKQQYKCILPQEHEQTGNRTIDVRNQDFQFLFSSDVAFFNFDGAELDSGTVVEYIFAKFLDIPSVIFRSDFRKGGDQMDPTECPWNLMCSFYPRTKIINLNGMAWYQDDMHKHDCTFELIESHYTKMAAEVVNAFDEVRKEKPVIRNAEEAQVIYEWAMRSAGGELATLINSKMDIPKLIQRRFSK